MSYRRRVTSLLNITTSSYSRQFLEKSLQRYHSSLNQWKDLLAIFRFVTHFSSRLLIASNKLIKHIDIVIKQRHHLYSMRILQLFSSRRDNSETLYTSRSSSILAWVVSSSWLLHWRKTWTRWQGSLLRDWRQEAWWSQWGWVTTLLHWMLCKCSCSYDKVEHVRSISMTLKASSVIQEIPS